MNRTDQIIVRMTPEEKRHISTVAAHLKISISTLMREGADAFLKERHSRAFDALWKRMSDALGKLYGDRIPASDVDLVRSVIGEMSIPTIETWANADLVDDKTFEEFLKAKIAVAKSEAAIGA